MTNRIQLGLTGDVMLGRAIDRILPNSVNGKIYENCIKHSDRYVELAQKANGNLPWHEIKEKGYEYIWGDVLDQLRSRSDCLIINLETALTTNEEYDSNKGINYRSHPRNVNALKIAGVSIVTLANDHILDWKKEGLKETISSLKNAGISCTGAGLNLDQAIRPAAITVTLSDQTCLPDKTKVNVVVAACGFGSAGIPSNWAASTSKHGINFIQEPNNEAVVSIRGQIDRLWQENLIDKDIKQIRVASLDWGPKWGFTPEKWRGFAHSLIDAGFDAVVSHSSHHVKGIEVYKGKFIAYGLGDFINDLEGIVNQGYAKFRHDLCCLYLPAFDTRSGDLVQLDIIPCKIKHLKVQRATNMNDIEWIRQVFCREGRSLKTSCVIARDPNGDVNLRLQWDRKINAAF